MSQRLLVTRRPTRIHDSDAMRLSVRVYPGARRIEVGGRYGDGEPPVLIVRVTAPAVEGKANRAVVDALATALGVRPSAVTIVSGMSARTKVIEVTGVDQNAVDQLLAL